MKRKQAKATSRCFDCSKQLHLTHPKDLSCGHCNKTWGCSNFSPLPRLKTPILFHQFEKSPNNLEALLRAMNLMIHETVSYPWFKLIPKRAKNA